MTEETRKEALEQLELDIHFGFENETELYDSIRDMFYDEEDFDEDWLRQTIAEKYSQLQQESVNWKRPTDFERLDQVFEALIMQKIVCLHKAGYTKQDGEGDCIEIIEKLQENGIKALGFCYYHEQDLARAVNKDNRTLLLGFDSATQDDEEALLVANMIVTALRENNFEVSWPGTVDQRIEIQNLDWRKLPDNEKRGAEQVMYMLTKTVNTKKPFWKFW